jgi:hypothetical protein
MTDLRALEYDSLRATIRLRGTLRPALLVFVIAGWAGLTLWVFTTDVVSAATLVPLAVLAAGFEAIYALHVSVERIGRYLQVQYETTPGWETTALSYSQRFRSPGPNGLFSGIFLITTAVNYLPAALSGTVPELAGLGIAHALFVVRVLVAVRRAGRQRVEDLERLRTLLAAQTSAPASAPASGPRAVADRSAANSASTDSSSTNNAPSA